MRLAFVFVVTGIAGCQGAPGDLAWPTGPEGARRGTRLRPLFLADGEGARVQIGFHDDERDEHCTFRWRMGMHETWCLPAWSPRDLVYFRDPACTQPLIDGMEFPGTRYVGRTLRWDESCLSGQLWPESGLEQPEQPPPSPELYRVGDEVATDVVYGGPTCNSQNLPGQRWRQLVSVALDEFVAGTEIDEGNGRMEERAIVGADGSRQPIWVHDGDLDALCSSIEFGDRPAACTPAAVHTDLGQDRDALFADPDCTRLMFPVETACDSWEPIWGEQVELGPSGSETTFYRLADEVSVSDTYTSIGDFCIRLSPRADMRYVLAGPAVAADQLATGQRVATGTGGRLESYETLVGDLRTRVGQDTFLDRELGTECRAGSASDGVTRCIPTLHAKTYRFEDCGNVTVHVVHVPPGSPPPLFAARALSTASTSYEVHRVGAALPVGTVLYWQDDAVGSYCNDLTVSDLGYYQLGEVVPPDELVELREVME